MNDFIIYGGAFNPPTIGHLQIIEYLLEHFPDKKLIILPTNNYYKSKEIVSFEHRVAMIKIMCNSFIDKIEISNYEQTLDKYYGTYYTLKHFNHPYFVIGADSLETIHSWINYPDVVIENKFIVFPRGTTNDINSIIENNSILKKYKNHFIICNDYNFNNISSTEYRLTKNKNILNENVIEYIKKNNLY